MLLPKDKFDTSTAESITGYSGVWSDEEIAQLLEWVQDANWPVARILLPYLKKSRQDLSRPVLSVLDGTDCAWMYWVLDLIDPRNLNEDLLRRLEKIARSPTEQESLERLPEKAHAILSEAYNETKNGHCPE